MRMMLRADDLPKRLARLPAVTSRWEGAQTSLIRTGSGAGPFAFDDVTVGFVFRSLARHEAAYGTDRRRHVPLAPGTGWLLPARLAGSCSWDGPSDFINLTIERRLLEQVGAGRLDFAPRYAFHDETALRIVLDLHEAAGEDGPTRLYRETMTLALAAHLARRIGETPDPVPAMPAIDDPRLARVVDHVEAHLPDDLSLETLAGIAAMSPFHFARSFKSRIGEPPHRYVMRRRVARACLLLRTTSLSVAEIGARVGWANPAPFGHAFRTWMGMSPGAYRAG